jgi:hypothetical protein
VEIFLKKGILERSLDGCCGGVGGKEEADEYEELLLLWPDDKSVKLSDAVCERRGASVAVMSPKYCSERATASLWGTPAKAITIRSGRKKAFL